MKEEQEILNKFYISRSKGAKSILSILRRRKHLIKDERVITYSGSPTKKAYVGVAKSPLMKAAHGGYGFQGVLLQTPNREFIQCHICGLWLQHITNSHLQSHVLKKDKITFRAYKKRFGLYLAKGLVSDALSYRYEVSGRKALAVLTPEKRKANTAAAIAGGRARAGKHFSHSTQYHNSLNTCEKQIGFRIIEYIKSYRELPKPSDKGEGRSICKVLYRRYGSVQNGFKHYGLPHYYRSGSAFELVAPNGKQLFYNFNKVGYSKAAVYDWMVKQCPALHPEAINLFADQKAVDNKVLVK